MARLATFGPFGDGENLDRYSRGGSYTGLEQNFSVHFYRINGQMIDIRYDVSMVGSTTQVNKAETWRSVRICFDRLPVTEQRFWAINQTTNPADSTPALQATVDAVGDVRLYYLGTGTYPGTLLSFIGRVQQGMFFEFEAHAKFFLVSTARWIIGEARIDRGVIGGGAIQDGTGTAQVAYRDLLGRFESTSLSMDVRFEQCVIDDADWIEEGHRLSYVLCAADGTYAQWNAAGIADWRARNTWPGIKTTLGGIVTGLQTTTNAQKHSYVMEDFELAGITGEIYCVVAHIYFATAAAGTSPKIIVIINGSEVDTTTWTQTTGSYMRFRIDSAFAVGDAVEIGVESSTGTTRIGSIFLEVEHDTPIPEPPVVTDDPANEDFNWVGNGTVQSLTLPVEPQLIFWWPRSNATAGGIWFAHANNAHTFADIGKSDPNFIVRGTELQLIGAGASGANLSGVQYDAIVIRDPAYRMIAPGAFSESTNTSRDDRSVVIETPHGTPFAPDALIAIQEVVNTTTFARFYGAGMSGDASTYLHVGGNPAADFIQALTSDGFVSGLSLSTEVQQVAFVGFRVGFLTKGFLIAVDSYTGDGAGGTRVVSVDLSGLPAKWAIVVPQNNADRAIMNYQQASGKSLNSSGGAYANSITALGTDSITVGTALNANGIVYSVLVFAFGPIVVTPCTGGGTVASGTNPDPPPSLATATAPISYVEITPVGGTTVSFAMAGVPYGSPKIGTVESFGHIDRHLSDGDGGPQASVITSSFIDTSRYFRSLVSSNVLRGALIEYFTADLATLKAEGDPTRRFRGRVANWKADPGLRFSITSEDELTARLTSIDAADVQIPQRLMDGTVTDNSPSQRMFEAPAPEGYGNVSDEDLATPVGVWECKHVTSITITGYEQLGNVRAFLIMAQVGTRVQALFAGDELSGDDIIERSRVPESAYGDWSTDDEAYFLKPGDAAYPNTDPWYDANNGRYWLIFGKDGHPSVELAVSGRIPLVCNFCGYETVGDGTGNTIASPARAFLHWLNNRVVQEATADWLSIAALDDYSLFDTDTFEDVHTLLDALGYTVQGLIGSDFRQRSWRDGVSEWCRNFGFDIGTNRHGQVILTYLDRTSDGSGATAFTPAQILERGCAVDMMADAVENEVRYVHSANYLTKIQDPNPAEGAIGLREPFDGPWLSGRQIIRNNTSITALGGDPRGVRRSKVQEYSLIRNADTAEAVATERLDLRSPPQGRAEVTFDLWLKDGYALELGDIVTIEHWDLPWTGARRCQVRALVTDLDAMIVTPTVRDVDDLLV